MIYRFLDFELHSKDGLLRQGNNEQQLPHKIFSFLQLLLQNPGEVVSRQRLEKTVWPGQIVTDTTIYQLVRRLRNILGDNEEGKPLIQTVHGKGYRIIPTVILMEEQPGSILPAAKPSHRYRYLLIFVLLLVFIFWYENTGVQDNTDTNSIISTASALPLRLSFIPAGMAGTENSALSIDWLHQGGMFYLAEILAVNTPLITFSPRKSWFKTENKEQLAIELINTDKTDLVLLADLKKHADGYSSDVQLRDKSGVIAANRFQSASLKDLMIETSHWAESQILPADKATIKHNTEDELSDDEFAIESYIRGMSAQLQGDNKRAIQFFQLSTAQDPDFRIAWYELAIAERAQGNYEKAVAIFNTLALIDDELTGRIANALGITYWRMNKHQLAEQAFQHALQTSNTQSTNSRRSIFTNLAILATKQKAYQRAAAYLDNALALTNPDDNPYSYGTIMNTYAGLMVKTGDLSEAIVYAEKAIDAFKKDGHIRYESSAKSRLSGILISMGKFQAAEALALEALTYRKSADDRSGQISSYLKLARLSTATGRFSAAEKYWDQAYQICVELDDKLEQANIRAELTDLYLRMDRLDAAELQLQLFNEAAVQAGSERFQTRLTILSLRLATQRNNFPLATKLARQLSSEKNAQAALYLGDLELAQGARGKAESEYLKAAGLMQDSSNNVVLAEIQNRLTALYLESNPMMAAESIEETLIFNPFPYPLSKYQARLLQNHGEIFKAATLLEQLKAEANQFWTEADEQRLESLRHQYQKNNLAENTPS